MCDLRALLYESSSVLRKKFVAECVDESKSNTQTLYPAAARHFESRIDRRDFPTPPLSALIDNTVGFSLAVSEAF